MNSGMEVKDIVMPSSDYFEEFFRSRELTGAFRITHFLVGWGRPNPSLPETGEFSGERQMGIVWKDFARLLEYSRFGREVDW